MAAMKPLQVKVKIAFWLKWYLSGVVLMCWLTKMRPDEQKLRYWIGRAVKVKVK